MTAAISTSSSTGTTSLGGVLSGINYESLITQEMAAAQVPLSNLNNRKTEAESKLSSLQAVETQFSSFQAQAKALKSIADIRGIAVSSTDSDIVSATASTGAIEGNYEVQVNQLAAAERRVHAGLASETDALGAAGQLVYTYDGTTRTIQTTDTTSLEDLVDLINNDSGNPGVVASVLQYDSGDGLAYHLVLGGRQTGADHTITIEAGTTLAGFDEAGGNWTVTQTARNAQVRLDSYPSTGWIESDTNTLSDLIPNVTVNLKQAGTASVSLSKDSSDLQSGLSNLVSIYNSIVDSIDKLAGYDAKTKTGGIFQGDSTVTSLIYGMRDQLASTATGFIAGDDKYTTAASIGLEMDKEGHLSLDTGMLSEALSDDYEGVLSLIAASGTGSVDSSDIQFNGTLSSTEAGSYQLKVTYDASGNITSAQFRDNDASSEWRDATVDGNLITGASSYGERGLSILVVSPQMGATMTYDVDVKQGFAGGLYDVVSDLLDPIDGAFKVKTDLLDQRIADLDDQIDSMQDRLDKREETLRAKYQRLEAALAKLDSMKSTSTP